MRPRRAVAATVLVLVTLGAACSVAAPARPGRADGDGGAAIVSDDPATIPCGPRRVLAQVCQQCHARPTRNGAPFSLETRGDVLAVRDGLTVRELAIDEIEAERMPLTPVTMTAEERTTLTAWLRSGAPAVTPTNCSDEPPKEERADATAD